MQVYGWKEYSRRGRSIRSSRPLQELDPDCNRCAGSVRSRRCDDEPQAHRDVRDDDVLGTVANALDVDDHVDQHETGRQVSRAAYDKVRHDLASYVAFEAVDVFVELVNIDFHRA